MKCDKIIELELLTEEDAWTLFQNRAGLSDRSSKNRVGRKIVKECKRLPIAIDIVASSLKGEQRQEEWDVALKSLQRPNTMQGDDENVCEIYKCLRYSYDNMKDKKAKELFLLCSMFREDEEIDDETLTRLSIAVGLVGEIDGSYDESRSQVVVTKNKLIDCCLLLKTDERSVKMHDTVREVALLIANEEVKAVNTCDKKDKSWVEKAKNLKYLLCEGKDRDVFSLGFDKSKLEILIVHMDEDGNDSVEIPDSFFQDMIRLRVFYLSDKTYRRRTLSSTQSIQSSTNIRSLYLKHFTLGDISILRNLQGLETIDLYGCSMDELPRAIAGLEKLKLLRLDYCQIERNNPFKVIESCYSLEELYFYFSFPANRSTLHQKVELPSKLRIFQIIERYYCSAERNSLNVSKADGVFSEATFKHLMQTSNSIDLQGLEGGWRNLHIILAEDEAALNLTRLCLESISEVECLIDAKHIGSRIQNVFPNLVQLALRQMKNLKELWSVPLTLCNLVSMILRDCPMLVTLFPLSTIQSLVLLEHLVIEKCEQLESIMTDEKEKEDSEEEEIVEGNNDNNSAVSLFPNLKTLCVERCPKLEFVFPGVAGRDFQKLEEIQIIDCVELKYVFGPYQHQQEQKELHGDSKNVIFATLEVMILEDLPNFVGIFREYDQYRSTSVKRSCSKEEYKTEIESSVKRSCSKDGFKCNIFHWSSKNRHKLRTAKLPLHSDAQDCTLSSNIDNIVGDTMNQKMSFLPRLLVLLIKKCNNIKCVFPFATSKMPPKLEVLAIIEASMLEEVFRWESDKKVEISDVKVAIFVELPSFDQGIEWSETCLVKNCPKLSLNSTSTPQEIRRILEGFPSYCTRSIKYMLDEIRIQETSNQNSITKEALLGNELTSSQVNTSQSMDPNIAEDNHVNGIESNDFIFKEKQTRELLEIEQEFSEKLPNLEIRSITTSPIKSCRSLSELDISLNAAHSLEVKRNVEEETTSAYGKTIASPIDLASENCEGQTAKSSFSIVKVEPDDGEAQKTSKSIITHL